VLCWQFNFGNGILVDSLLTSGSEHVYWISDLDGEGEVCTQYMFCGEGVFQECKGNLFYQGLQKYGLA